MITIILKRLIAIFIFYSITLNSCTLTQLFYHRGKITDKIVFFLKEKPEECVITRATKSKNRAAVTLNFGSSSISSIISALENLLEASSSRDYKISRAEFNNNFLITFEYDPAYFSITCKKIVSDRFGNGLVVSIANNKINKTDSHEKLHVFIDCGHGGTDNGARGVTGVLEKNITQVIGKQLAELCDQAGYSTLLVPSSDIFTPLDSRTTQANNFQADIFISLHADSSSKRHRSGISIRTPLLLDLLESAEFASELIDNRDRARSNMSKQLAEYIDIELSKINFNKTSIKPSIHCDPFQVLLGTEMPAVLIEMGFLSNAEDCARLEDPIHQKAIAQAIVRALKYKLKFGQ